MAVKMKIFRCKKCDIFFDFAQNIDFGYILEPPQISEVVHSMFIPYKVVFTDSGKIAF